MREISLLKKNILKYLEFKGISKYEFYQKTGISNGILSQNNGLSEDNTLKFLSYYTDINPEWLLTGNGNMLKDLDKNMDPGPAPPEHLNYKEIADERKELIAMQREKITRLEQDLSDTKKALQDCETARGVVKHLP